MSISDTVGSKGELVASSFGDQDEGQVGDYFDLLQLTEEMF